MNAAVAVFIYGLVPEFLMRFLAWLLVHTFYRVDKEGPRPDPGNGPVRPRLQSRELRRCGRDRRVRAAADPLRDGPPDLQGAAALVHLPHDAHDPDRAGEGGRGDEGPRIRRGREGARGRRDRRHLPGGQAHGQRASSILSARASSRSSRRRRCRWCRLRCADLWGSFFSRSHDGKAMRRLRGVFSRIALVAAPPVPAERVTLDGLQATVLALRGDRK